MKKTWWLSYYLSSNCATACKSSIWLRWIPSCIKLSLGNHYILSCLCSPKVAANAKNKWLAYSWLSTLFPTVCQSGIWARWTPSSMKLSLGTYYNFPCPYIPEISLKRKKNSLVLYYFSCRIATANHTRGAYRTDSQLQDAFPRSRTRILLLKYYKSLCSSKGNVHGVP